jgi:Putative beta-barrel porin-2, OmpL-like. bbp2
VDLYLDTYYGYSLNHPRDNTIVGSGAVGRDTEWQINNATIGVETNYKNVIGKITLQTGNQAAVTQDLDGTVNRGRNLTIANNKYIGEAVAGYHFDKLDGINVEAGYFYSYIGLESYLLAENWNYNRSFLSDFTPFYFSGARVQIYPTDKLKIEPWVMNGYQTYGKWSKNSSIGLSNTWRPRESLGFVANFYYGTDAKDDPHRKRFQHDDSVLWRYYNRPEARGISKMAFSLNNHFGNQWGGVNPFPGRKEYMVGSSFAHRIWFDHDHLAWSFRAGGVTNPGRYLAYLPTPNGFPPSSDNYSLKLWDLTSTFDIMPTDFLAFRFEFISRHSNVPYFSGRGGTTSPDGWQGTLGPFVLDVAKHENRLTFAINWRM